MILRSLRKLQITRWNIPQATGINRKAGRSAGRRSVVAGTLLGFLLSVCGTAAAAEEWKSRTGKKRPVPVVRPASQTRVVSEQLVIPAPDAMPPRTAVHSPLDRLMNTQPETVIEAPDHLPPAGVPLSPPEIAERVKPSLQAAIDAGSCTPETVGPVTWGDYYSHRFHSVLNGSEESGDQSFGEWWHENSLILQQRNRHTAQAAASMVGVDLMPAPGEEPIGAREIAGRVRNHVSNFIADHTLPPQDVPEQDSYEMSPRAVALGPVRTVSDQVEQKESRVERLTRDITAIQPTLSYALKGIENDQLPADFFDTLENGPYVPRQAAPMVMQWAPTNLWHHPLYFEDPALERYGHTYHPIVQPFASTGRFATQLVGLPYQMTLHPVHAKEYTLGWYRPGDCAPKKFYQIPFNEEAALMQTAVMAGLFLIIP